MYYILPSCSPGRPTLMSWSSQQNLGPAELCGSRTEAISLSDTWAVQSPLFTGPNLGLLGPYELCRPHPEDPTPPKVCGTPAGGS